ncbi:heterokaryon incompatibility protein 6, OR allele [Naviculisporaceae sp. PSN 640]
MTQLLSPQFFKAAYDEMENDLKRRSENNSLCQYCTDKEIPSIFRPRRDQPSVNEVKKPHGRLSDLAVRRNCPFCRVLCCLMETGSGTNCCGDCRSFYSPTENPDRVITVVTHISHGDLHFVHPTQADHFRIKEWINTCDASHSSCTEHVRTPDTLFGHGKYALRLIDVELRMIVKSLHPVRYLTLSYVWGASANRRFEMIPNPYSHDDPRFPPGIEPVDRQIPEMMYGRLSRTFEDLICFARRLGERYIWVDAICIPQDEPDILVHQLALMDQVYFHGVCNIVSLTSGVEDGLPGASAASPRNTRQLVEELPDGTRIATPLWELYPLIQYVPWVTRGWTLQEHLLAKRSIFFAHTEVIFVCKQMSAKESWKYPRKATDIEPNDKAERWYEYNLPLPSGKCRDLASPDLTSTLSTIVQMYTNRYLTYASDKHNAFKGLEARLAETYGVEFAHGHPFSKTHFPASLLWGRVDFRDENQQQQQQQQQSGQSKEDWPSWSWLGQPSAVAYKYWSPWSSTPDLLLHGPLTLPRTEILFEQDHTFQSLPCPNAGLMPLTVPSTVDHRRILKITGLSLDINTADYPPSSRRNHLPHAMSLWENKSFSTPGRGPITFNLVVIPDLLPSNGNDGFPLDTKKIRLLYVGTTNGDGTGYDEMRPKMPLLLQRGEEARMIKPTSIEKGETEFSRVIDWVEPDYSSKNNWLGVEPDVCLLIVEAVDDPEVPVKRLGIAHVRTMDFLIAGAKVREVLLA